MIFKIILLTLVLVIQDGFFCMKIDHGLGVYDRQEDLPVEFLFWSTSEAAGGNWVWNWTTWSFTWVTQGNTDPVSIRFDSSVDGSFGGLLANVNNFKIGGKTKIIIHGYNENGRAEWITRMKKAYYAKDSGINVVSVEWSQLAQGPDYPLAAANTQIVGKHVGDFINYMIGRTETTFTLNDFHIVGFSLGAQVAGKAGDTLNGKVGRITGLDPAGPEFEGKDKRKRLDSTDAIFVDVIHTSANANPTIGNKEELGDKDFWPNGGNSPMPGTEATFYPSGISHLRAYEYFIESISNPMGFRARRSDNYEAYKTSGGCAGPEEKMGEAATPDGPIGNYYVGTNSFPPYARGQTCFN